MKVPQVTPEVAQRRTLIRKETKRLYTKKYREEHREVLREKARLYRKKPEVRARIKARVQSPKYRLAQQRYRDNPINKLRNKERSARLRNDPVEREKRKAYERRPEVRARNNEYVRWRLYHDPVFKAKSDAHINNRAKRIAEVLREREAMLKALPVEELWEELHIHDELDQAKPEGGVGEDPNQD